jgi:4-amino-4-deoxy-L-arabinose transferase-like glycosyltransferase
MRPAATAALPLRSSGSPSAGLAGAPGGRRLIASILLLCVLSVPVFCARFLNDMDVYSLVADKMLTGGVLYQDAIDTKPPLVFLHYAAVFTLFGRNNVAAVKIVTMVWLGASALVMASTRRRMFPGSPAPELATLLFVLASFSGWGEDFLSSNTEILANLFVLLGILTLARDDCHGSFGSLIAAGAFIGVAFLYRYQAAAPLAAYVLTVVLLPRRFERPFQRLTALGLGFLLPLTAVVAYYVRIGGLPDLGLLLRYQAHYVRTADALYLPLILGRLAIVFVGLAPFFLLTGWQASTMLRKADLSRGKLFLLLWLVCSVGTVAIGGRFFPHYAVAAIPPLVLLAAERLSQIDRNVKTTHGAGASGRRSWYERHARAFILLHAASFTVVNTAYYLARRPEPANPALVAFVKSHTDARDQVLLWTWRPELLFEVDRVFATRFLSNELLIGRLDPIRARTSQGSVPARGLALRELWPLLMRELGAQKPRLIIDDTPDRSRWTVDRYPELAPFVAEYYDACRVIDNLCVYLRKQT